MSNFLNTNIIYTIFRIHIIPFKQPQVYIILTTTKKKSLEYIILTDFVDISMLYIPSMCYYKYLYFITYRKHMI